QKFFSWHIKMYLIISLCLFSTRQMPSEGSEPPCNRLTRFGVQGFYKTGEIILGGLFPMHSRVINQELSFNVSPNITHCEGFDFRTFRWLQVMFFTLEEINNSTELLPNITLGYIVYDTCATSNQALRAALSLASGPDNFETIDECGDSPLIPVILGDSGSTQSMALAKVLSPFRIPMVSYFASCAYLSNQEQFPIFFRTIPSDFYQARALAKLVQRFGWTWVGAIGADDDYGRDGVQSFNNEVKKFGACVAFKEIIPKVTSKVQILRIVKTIKRSTAKVIVLFAIEADAYPLLQELALQNITDKQWIASEAWVTSALISTDKSLSFLAGTIGFAIRRAEMPELKDFLLKVHPLRQSQNMFTREFWETLFECSFQSSSNITGELEPTASNETCTGLENFDEKDSIYSDITQLRVSYNIYKAIYAIVHALHNLYSCTDGEGPFAFNSCANIFSLQPWQVLHYLTEVRFTDKFGQETYFDENGDPVGSYDILNWQKDITDAIQYVQIGDFDASAEIGMDLVIDEQKIIWSGGQTKVPRSVCTESCQPGTRKTARVGQSVCCFDCLPCADGEISNETDAVKCIQCSLDYWPNGKKDKCILKEIEFLSFHDTLGITLTIVSLVGALTTLTVASVFLQYKTTPIVRANNSELSFLLLFSLILCFLCSLSFIGRPTVWSCMLRHTLFGISFVLCISCVLGKTIVVLMAFKATLPGNNVMQYFGPTQQRLIVSLCTLIQVTFCIVWVTVLPPIPYKNSSHYSYKIILECALGSLALYGCVMGYIGFLSCICFILAFFARKLPDNFNEAKFITFSLIIFCAVWITFIPAYISSPGKYTVAVEVFAILSSSFGLLLCIFAPKCYVILLKPEKNTKKHMM
uniref:Olfactory receptor C family, w1 n=1 Tax=Latimeria chalumnae TaxID=7897 RepID=H3A7C1_LATCH